MDVKRSDVNYGNTFVKIDMRGNVREQAFMALEIKKNGKVVGDCRAEVNV